MEQGERNGAEIILGDASNFKIIVFVAVVPLFWGDGSFIRCFECFYLLKASVPREICSVIGGIGVPGCWDSCTESQMPNATNGLCDVLTHIFDLNATYASCLAYFCLVVFFL
jgi:hypothetical protein